VSRRRQVLLLFGVLSLVQLAVPASMIARYELALSHGTVFKVHTSPVDPVDAFRGRYVWFRLALGPVELDRSIFGKTVWVSLEKGPDGFAKVSQVSATRPASGSYVGAQAVPVEWRSAGPGRGRFQLVLPHDRYYMEEWKAPQAEGAARAHSREPQRNAWVTLRVRDGIGAVEGLWIDGVPIEEYLRRGR
jgi:GDYXXLXY protein